MKGNKYTNRKNQRALKQAEVTEGTKVYNEPMMTRQDGKYSTNSKEDRMLEAFDTKRSLEKLIDWVDKLDSGKADVTNFFGGLAPEAAIELAQLMFSKNTGEKVRLEAIKSWLDRAGYGAVSKHAIAQVDADAPKEAIINLIMGKKGKLGEEIEIVEDDDDEEDSY